MLLLEDTIGQTIAELIDENVQTAFGGIRFPTAIKYGEGSVIQLSDLIAVEIHRGGVLFVVLKHNLGVGIAPVSVSVESGDHLGFDLTHESEKGLRVVGVVIPLRCP